MHMNRGMGVRASGGDDVEARVPGEDKGMALANEKCGNPRSWAYVRAVAMAAAVRVSMEDEGANARAGGHVAANKGTRGWLQPQTPHSFLCGQPQTPPPLLVLAAADQPTLACVGSR